MSLPEFVLPIGLAVALGLLVGLQREWATREIAGIRTFPLITVFGALTALLAPQFGAWTVVAGLLVLGLLVVAGHVIQERSEEGRQIHGITTEVAALLMFGVGAALGADLVGAAIVVAGIVAVLLHAKPHLHGLVDRLGEGDLSMIFRLVLVALVILPALPDRDFGPYAVLNPFEIWLMVVLIVGISTAAYVAYKLFGARWGTLFTGAMGGLISSTATTVSYARRTRADVSTPAAATLVIAIASTIVFVRVLVEIALVAPALLASAAPPLGAAMALMAVICVALYVRLRGDLEPPADDPDPPSELAGAIVFGLLYAAVLVGVAAARDHFGDTGVYVMAAISGLTDMDAITLSTAQLFGSDHLDAGTAWKVILVGSMANLVFKSGMAAVIGGRALARYVAIAFGPALVGSALVLFLWPS